MTFELIFDIDSFPATSTVKVIAYWQCYEYQSKSLLKFLQVHYLKS